MAWRVCEWAAKDAAAGAKNKSLSEREYFPVSYARGLTRFPALLTRVCCRALREAPGLALTIDALSQDVGVAPPPQPLVLERGRCYAFVGRNRSGKSTLVQALARVVGGEDLRAVVAHATGLRGAAEAEDTLMLAAAAGAELSGVSGSEDEEEEDLVEAPFIADVTVTLAGAPAASTTTTAVTHAEALASDSATSLAQTHEMPLHAIPRLTWRTALTHIAQKPYIFAGTLAENVRCGDASVPDWGVAWALEMAGLVGAGAGEVDESEREGTGRRSGINTTFTEVVGVGASDGGRGLASGVPAEDDFEADTAAATGAYTAHAHAPACVASRLDDVGGEPAGDAEDDEERELDEDRPRVLARGGSERDVRRVAGRGRGGARGGDRGGRGRMGGKGRAGGRGWSIQQDAPPPVPEPSPDATNAYPGLPAPVAAAIAAPTDWASAELLRGLIRAEPLLRPSLATSPMLAMWVDARGANVSGGFAQSISLARAFLRLRSQLCVVDEATGQMDATKVAWVVPRLLRVARARDMALVVISHHLHTVTPLVDQVWVLERGRVVEVGHHTDLIQAGAVYGKLYGQPA
jgi:energy-coupling factor transporter ATP-binding protein EcfA2